MQKLIIENTEAPFGIEGSGNIIYLKVLLERMNSNHEYIKDRVEYYENEECKKFGKIPVISNIRKLKDNNDLLRIKINNYKGRKLVKMSYSKNCLKEDYLKTIDDLTLDAKINVKFTIGKGYTFQADGVLSFGLNLILDEITIL